MTTQGRGELYKQIATRQEHGKVEILVMGDNHSEVESGCFPDKVRVPKEAIVTRQGGGVVNEARV